MADAQGTSLAGRRVGFIGIGRMGTPISRRLMAAGAELTVFDVIQANMDALAAEGATAADSAAAVCRASDAVFSMLPDDGVLLSAVTGAGGVAETLGPGKTFIDMSTVSPGVSAQVAEALAGTGGAYLRCPVSGSTATAASGSLAVFCSGPAEAFEDCREVLAAFSAAQTHFGPAEEARVVKLMINMIVVATPWLIGEALAIGGRLGLDWQDMVDAVGSSVVASPLVVYKVEPMKARDWTPAAPIDLTAKDLGMALDVAASNGFELPVSALLQKTIEGFQARGEGQEDFFKLVTWPEAE